MAKAKEKIVFSSPWDSYEVDAIVVGHYSADGSLCIDLDNYEEGPITRLTVCLSDKKLKENQAYIDTNNNPMAVQFIYKYKLGTCNGNMKASGYCIYPLCDFNMERLKELAN